MRLGIKYTHERINQLNRDYNKCLQELTSTLTLEHWETLNDVVTHNTLRVKEFISNKHTRKLEELGVANDCSGYVDKNKWIANLSSRQLTTTEIQSLQYGLNFALTPKSIPVPKIIASIESGIRTLPENSKASIRASVTNILKYSRPPATTNISRQQNVALRNLSRDKNITILPADKGRTVVVMNTNEFVEKIDDLLSDNKTYLKITDKRRNPTSKLEKELTKL